MAIEKTINELDLWRTFQVLKGQYAGEYKLYFNRKVAEYYLPDSVKIYKWGEYECLEARAGDYIESYDGSVCILIRVRRYVSKTTTCPFYFFRFPMCTITAYQTKTVGFKFREFYAQLTYLNKDKVSPVVLYGSKNQKLNFAQMLVGGVHAFKAYRIAFGFNQPLGIETLHKRISNLMKDEIVIAEIRTQVMPLMEKLGENFTDARLAKELSQLIDMSRKGSDAHRENIKFIMALMDKLPEKMYPGSKASKSMAVDIPHEVVAPTLGKE